LKSPEKAYTIYRGMQSKKYLRKGKLISYEELKPYILFLKEEDEMRDFRDQINYLVVPSEKATIPLPRLPPKLIEEDEFAFNIESKDYKFFKTAKTFDADTRDPKLNEVIDNLYQNMMGDIVEHFETSETIQDFIIKPLVKEIESEKKKRLHYSERLLEDPSNYEEIIKGKI
jgi:hypothetical protein